MAFIQVIRFETDGIEEIQRHVDDYRAATEGTRTTRRSILCRDRDNEGRYVNLAFFDSYESAMQNSELPETSELAAKLTELANGEPEFMNLEIEWEGT